MTVSVQNPPIDAAASLLDIELLLSPIPGEDPAGDAHSYPRRLRSTLDDLRKHRNNGDDGSNYSERSDWTAAIKLCVEALRTDTKDLRIAGHLTEAMLQLHGFAGLREALVFLRRLIEECWDRLNPPLDNDPETRAAPLANILDDPDRGFCFPNTVRLTPLIGVGDLTYGAYQWKRLKSKGDAASEEAATAALNATSPDQLQAFAQDIEDCLTELHALTAVLDERMGDQAPGMYHLGEAIRECQALVQCELPKILPPDVMAAAEPLDADPLGESIDLSGEPSPEPAGAPTPQQILQVRARAYAQLDTVADLLLQIEPHSPIPYLVKRAVSLGRMPFPQLAKEVLRQEALMSELTREFGLPDQA